MKTERRFLSSAEFRMEGDDAPKILGYAALFNSMSEDLGGFREVIAPGAFSETLEEDVRALWNHDPNHVLGRTKAGTLALSEDERGLKVEITPPAGAAGHLESMRRGDVDQMSFAFRVMEGGDSWEIKGDQAIRTLTKVKISDVSVVTYPAYPETEAALRSLDQFREAAAPEYRLVKARLRLAAHG